MIWEMSLEHFDKAGCVAIYKFDTGEMFPGPQYKKFTWLPEDFLSETDTKNQLKFMAEKNLVALNKQTELEEKGFTVAFENATQNLI